MKMKRKICVFVLLNATQVHLLSTLRVSRVICSGGDMGIDSNFLVRRRNAAKLHKLDTSFMKEKCPGSPVFINGQEIGGGGDEEVTEEDLSSMLPQRVRYNRDHERACTPMQAKKMAAPVVAALLLARGYITTPHDTEAVLRWLESDPFPPHPPCDPAMWTSFGFCDGSL